MLLRAVLGLALCSRAALGVEELAGSKVHALCGRLALRVRREAVRGNALVGREFEGEATRVDASLTTLAALWGRCA
eukprot:1454479-Rhodomonas_salina.2